MTKAIFKRVRTTLPAAIATSVAALSLAACDDEPSYQLRWKIAGTGVLEQASQCSRAGIAAVEISTFSATDLVDQRVVPCFPNGFEDPDATIAGPAVDSGSYEVVVRGLRRDQIGWANPLAEEPVDPRSLSAPRCEQTSGASGCPDEYLVCDCQFVDLRSGETEVLDAFTLEPPGECDDGIDNDADGLVDAFDVGCRFGGSAETNTVSAMQLRLDMSFLGGNPNARCAAVGVSQFVIRVDDQVIATPECTLSPIFVSANVQSGPREVSIVATDREGQPLTRPETVTVDVGADGGYFNLAVDFGDTDFLERIEDEAAFVPQFISYEDAPFTRSCTPNRFGQLELSDLRIRILDAHGGPLANPVALSDGTVANGQTLIPCESNVLQTNPLVWGGYLVELEALSSTGEVCFSNAGAPTPLAPGEPFLLSIPRVLVEEGDRLVPPPGCEDCQQDSDCPESTCEDRMCRLSGS